MVYALKPKATYGGEFDDSEYRQLHFLGSFTQQGAQSLVTISSADRERLQLDACCVILCSH